MIKALVTPKVMQWAREAMSMSFEDVAKQFSSENITDKIVEDWESGDKQPSYSQLEYLAHDIYKRPVVVFFFPHPPKENGIEKQLRSLPNTKALTPRIHDLVRKAEVFQMNLHELNNRVNPVPQKIFSSNISISPQSDIPAVAKEVRGYLGLSSINLSRKNKQRDHDILQERINSLERFGISVFKDAFRNHEFSGFCLHDEQFPIIYLNNSMLKPRQSFTLFHELAHILMKKGGIDFRHKNPKTPNDPIDIICNKFAGEVLVPPDDFLKDLHRFPDNLFDEETIDNSTQELAGDYSVSREVILRKLLANNRITNDDYNKHKIKYDREWETNRKKSSQEGSSGGNPYNTKKSYISDTYINTVFEKYHHGQIDKYQCADYMHMKFLEIDRLSATYAKKHKRNKK